MIKLYQFPVSHYCEKVRWALDFKGLKYRKINLVPGPHVRKVLQMASRSQVPVLEDGKVIVQGSAEIIDYLESKYPERSLTPKDPSLAEQSRAWEERLDRVAGPAVRTFNYHFLLPFLRAIVPLLTAKQSMIVSMMFYVGYRKLSNTLRGWMNINETSAHKAMNDMDELLNELRQIYANTRYLVGDEFTRADLTACALFAPLFRPNGYGLKWPTDVEEPAEMKHWKASHERALQSLAIRYEQNR